MAINNFIIVFVVLIIAYFNIKKEYEKSVCILGVSYVCLPAIKTGNGIALNSSYLLTLVCVMMILHIIVNKKIYIDKTAIQYFVAMNMGLAVIGIALLVNGNPKWGDIIHFAGMEQYIVGVYSLVTLIKTHRLNKRVVFRKIITSVIILNYIIGMIQLFNWNLGEKITRQLYVYGGKDAPINTMKNEVGRFTRIFGTFYSPTVLGVMSLIMLTFMAYELISDEEKFAQNAILYIASLGLGLLAFSKLTIIGVFLTWILEFVLLLMKRKIQFIRKHVRTLGITILTFLVIGTLQCMIGLGPYVGYYYFKATNIKVALGSRYENLIEGNYTENTWETEKGDNGQKEIDQGEEKEIDQGEEKERHTGNLSDTFEIVKEHLFIGVGPGQVRNEFVGDSEYITLLHNGGVMCFVIYAVFYGGLIMGYYLQEKYQELFILVTIGIGGISMMIFSYSCIIPFLSFCICVDKEEKILNERNNC